MGRLYKVATASFLVGVMVTFAVLRGLGSTFIPGTWNKDTVADLNPLHSTKLSDSQAMHTKMADNHNISSKATPADKLCGDGPDPLYETYTTGSVWRRGMGRLCGSPYTLTPPCIVFSFGINYDFSFDDAVAREFNCVVHSFDPSMARVKDHMRGNWIHFHKIGLDDKNYVNPSEWKLQTFSTILKETMYSNATIDVLKFDIECAELRAIPEMLKAGSLKNVKQLCFEMHIKRGYEQEPDSKKYIFGLSIFRDLYNEGFRIFKSHKNMYPKYKSMFGMERTGCHEVYMIRVH